MPTIVFVSPKGGAGKTTSALVLATQLALKTKVIVVDADPNHPIKNWASGPNTPESLSVVSDADEENIIDKIEDAAAQAPFVVVDLEGTAKKIVLLAVSQADLVVIPVQGSQLDAEQASRALKVVKQQEKMSGNAVPHFVLFTRTSVLLRSREMKEIHKNLTSIGVPVFKTELHERAAFKAMFSFRETLENLNPKEVAKLDKAISNAEDFTQEVIGILRQNQSAKVA